MRFGVETIERILEVLEDIHYHFLLTEFTSEVEEVPVTKIVIKVVLVDVEVESL